MNVDDWSMQFEHEKAYKYKTQIVILWYRWNINSGKTLEMQLREIHIINKTKFKTIDNNDKQFYWCFAKKFLNQNVASPYN